MIIYNLGKEDIKFYANVDLDSYFKRIENIWGINLFGYQKDYIYQLQKSCRRMLMTTDKINERFGTKVFTDDSKSASIIIRDSIIFAAQNIDAQVPDGREKSLAFTKLEEALMWSNKGIAAGQKENNE